ncbi:MAG: LysR family transcriptional regulator [Cytophagales bacterium]|nr:MAG: LysR family transcriptional regulator [Cytophagales bacterium]
MNIDQIRYFLGLADELHFWNASEKLNITQSALSRHIQALEAELGVVLFDRTKRKVELTAAGTFLKTEWARLLTELDNVQRQARLLGDGETGTLRVGHPSSIRFSILPDLVVAMIRAYPNVRMELVSVDDVDMEELLMGYQIDIGFEREHPGHASLASRLLLVEPMALVVPESHAISAATFQSLSQVADEPFVLPSHCHNGLYMQTLYGLFPQYGFTPNVVFESDHGTTLLSLVARGLGVTILPLSYEKGAPAGVRFLPLPHDTSLYMIWRQNNNCNLIRNTIRVATDVLTTETA